MTTAKHLGNMQFCLLWGKSLSSSANGVSSTVVVPCSLMVDNSPWKSEGSGLWFHNGLLVFMYTSLYVTEWGRSLVGWAARSCVFENSITLSTSKNCPCLAIRVLLHFSVRGSHLWIRIGSLYLSEHRWCATPGGSLPGIQYEQHKYYH